MKKYLLLFLLGILVSACSTGLQKNKQKQNEIELSKAAQSSKPPQPVEFDPRNIDPAYLRMQADYHFTLAESFALDGNIERAIEEYKLTLVYDPNSPQVRLKLAGELAKKGQLVQAVDQAEEAVKLEDKFADGHLFLGNLYTMTKLYDRAKEEYQRAYDLDPQNTDAPMYIGAILAEEKKYDESIAYFNKLTKKFKQTHLIYYYIGRIELERKNDKKAEIEFKKAIHAKPDFLDAVVSLGALLESQNKIKEATQTYLAYQQKRGRSSKIAYALGRIYMDQNNYADAYKQFTLIEDTEPDNLNVKVKMALILIEQKKYPKAISKLKEILVQAPDSEKIRFYLAAVYEEVKSYAEAAEQFEVIQPISNLYPEAMIHASYNHKLLGDLEKATKTLEAAIEKRPDVPQFYTFYASLLDEQKQTPRAVDALTAAAKRFNQNDQIFFYLGSMQDKVGSRKDSLTSMRKAIEINPENVQALNYLGYTLTEMNQELIEAEAHIVKALKLKPGDAYITDSYGWVLFKQGKVKEAIEVLEGAYRLKTDEAIIAEHLGDAYLHFSLPDKARQMYMRAATLETNENNRRKIKNKLSDLENPVSKSIGAKPQAQSNREPAQSE